MMKQNIERDYNFNNFIAERIKALRGISGGALNEVNLLSMNAKGLEENQIKEVTHLSQMLAQINSELMELQCFYDMEKEQFALTCVEYSLKEFLEYQVYFISLLTKASDILFVDLECDKKLVWEFDQLLLTTIIKTAAINASKIANKRIKFLATKENDFLKITIETDAGSFPDEVLGSNINLINETIISEENNNLDLYFAKTIAAMHCVDNKQGYLELSNNSSIGGSTFNIFLP